MLPRASSRLGFDHFDLQQPPWLGVEAATILTKNLRAEIQLQPARGSTQSIEDFHLNPWHPKCPMDHVVFSGSYWLQCQEKTTIIGSRIQFLLRKKGSHRQPKSSTRLPSTLARRMRPAVRSTQYLVLLERPVSL